MRLAGMSLKNRTPVWRIPDRALGETEAGGDGFERGVLGHEGAERRFFDEHDRLGGKRGGEHQEQNEGGEAHGWKKDSMWRTPWEYALDPCYSSRPTMASPSSIANAVLSANDLTTRYGVQTILDHATLAINDGDRVGLVGRNGTGKSTFLRIVAGVAEPDSGQIVRRRELITGYLPQDFQLDDARTVEDNILMGAQQVLDLVAEYEAGPADDTRADELLNHINHLDGWDVGHRVKALITHLDAPAADRLAGSLSGGEKTPRRTLPRAAGPARSAHPRRTDQPSRHRLHRVAGGLPQKLSRHLHLRDARPLFPRPRRQPHRGTRGRKFHLAPRQLHGVPRSQVRPHGQRRGAGSRASEIPQARTRMGPPGRTPRAPPNRATAWTVTMPSRGRPGRSRNSTWTSSSRPHRRWRTASSN